MKKSIILKTQNDQKSIHLKDRIKEIDDLQSVIESPEEIEIPPGVSIRLYGEKNFNRNQTGPKNGKEIILDSGNQYYIIDLLKDLEFEIKSLIAYPQKPVALLYTNPNFKGEIIPIYQDTPQNGNRSIQIPSIKELLKNHSVESDQIQSIQLSPNLGLILYQDEHFDQSAILNLSKKYHPSELILPPKVFSVIVGHLSYVPKPVKSIQGGPVSSFINLNNQNHQNQNHQNQNNQSNQSNQNQSNQNNINTQNQNNINTQNQNNLNNQNQSNLNNQNQNNLNNINTENNQNNQNNQNINYLLIFLFIIVIGAIILYLFSS